MNNEQSQLSDWCSFGFSVENTLDGSPTLRLMPQLQFQNERRESMHHSGGAFSESLYIYGQIIDEAMKKLRLDSVPVRTLSLGLGLGYNELLTAAFALKHQQESTFELDSYEIVPGLVQSFLSFCRGESLSSEISATYRQLLTHYENHFQIEGQKLLQVLVAALDQGRWQIKEDFISSSKTPCHVLLYDAFSGKTDDRLWTEEFLAENLQTCSCENALFATYACRASLKKSLTAAGYEVVVRDGFLGKRNSTQGRRGCFQTKA